MNASQTTNTTTPVTKYPGRSRYWFTAFAILCSVRSPGRCRLSLGPVWVAKNRRGRMSSLNRRRQISKQAQAYTVIRRGISGGSGEIPVTGWTMRYAKKNPYDDSSWVSMWRSGPSRYHHNASRPAVAAHTATNRICVLMHGRRFVFVGVVGLTLLRIASRLPVPAQMVERLEQERREDDRDHCERSEALQPPEGRRIASRASTTGRVRPRALLTPSGCRTRVDAARRPPARSRETVWKTGTL